MSDDELNLTAKAALEDGAGISSETCAVIVARARHAAIRRRRRLWLFRSAATLAAACIVVVAGRATLSAASPARDAELMAVIDLLQPADVVCCDDFTTSSERLLAWQDAPYISLQEEQDVLQ